MLAVRPALIHTLTPAIDQQACRPLDETAQALPATPDQLDFVAAAEFRAQGGEGRSAGQHRCRLELRQPVDRLALLLRQTAAAPNLTG